MVEFRDAFHPPGEALAELNPLCALVEHAPTRIASAAIARGVCHIDLCPMDSFRGRGLLDTINCRGWRFPGSGLWHQLSRQRLRSGGTTSATQPTWFAQPDVLEPFRRSSGARRTKNATAPKPPHRQGLGPLFAQCGGSRPGATMALRHIGRSWVPPSSVAEGPLPAQGLLPRRRVGLADVGEGSSGHCKIFAH